MNEPVYIVVSGIADYFSLSVRDEDLAKSMESTYQRLVKESYKSFEVDNLVFDSGFSYAQFSNIKECLDAVLLLERKLAEFSFIPQICIIHALEKNKVAKWKKSRWAKLSNSLLKIGVEDSVIITSPVHEELVKLEGYGSEFVENYEVEGLDEVVSVYALEDDFLVTPDVEAIHAKVAKESPSKEKRKASFTHILIALSTLIGMSAVFAYLNVLNSDPIINDYSIAVLPFRDITTETDSTEIKMSYGISDAVIDHLVKLEDLVVISHYSSRNVLNYSNKISEISSLLGVAYVLEGNVTYDDDSLTIDAQVIDVQSSQAIWENSYYRSIEDLLVVESEIAKEIVDLLKINLSFDDMKAVVGLPTDNIDSYENYVLGQQENLKKSVTANRKSIDYYGKAIRLDTTFANAYAEIASSTLERIIYKDATPREVIRLAKIYLDKAEELNDQLATIYSCRGLISIYEENYQEAFFNYEKAIRMAPNDPDIRLGFARYFNTVNEYEKQIEQNRLAYKLDPLSFDTAQKFAQALLVNKKYKEVEILLEDFRTKFGNKYTNQINRLYIQNAIGTQNFDQAISDLKALAWTDSLQLGALGYSYGRKNDTVMAKTVIDSIKILEDFPMKNYEIATVFAGLGNRDSVLYYLDSTRINPTILISKDMDYPQILTDVNIFNKLILNYYK